MFGVQSLTCILPEFYSLASKTTVIEFMTGRYAAGISGIFGAVADIILIVLQDGRDRWKQGWKRRIASPRSFDDAARDSVSGADERRHVRGVTHLTIASRSSNISRGSAISSCCSCAAMSTQRWTSGSTSTF